jgi:methylamine dehydrogenase accessory protein MauD
MEGVWLISYIALWALTLLLCVVVLAHSRLLGLLHHRFGPAHARPLADGPEVGTRLGRLGARRLDGSPWEWEFPAAGDLLLVFLSPQCQTCNELTPHLRDFAHAHPDENLVLWSTLDDPAMNRAYAAFRRLEKLTYVVGEKQAEALNVLGTPYALSIDRDGVVRAKGLVNHYEHLRSLFPPPRNGSASGDGSSAALPQGVTDERPATA